MGQRIRPQAAALDQFAFNPLQSPPGTAWYTRPQIGENQPEPVAGLGKGESKG